MAGRDAQDGGQGLFQQSEAAQRLAGIALGKEDADEQFRRVLVGGVKFGGPFEVYLGGFAPVQGQGAAGQGMGGGEEAVAQTLAVRDDPGRAVVARKKVAPIKVEGGRQAVAETWRNLTALHYHFETQPLPTLLGYYAHALPSVVKKGLVVFTLVTETLLPLGILVPSWRRVVLWPIALLQLGI
ncbi:MAG TPA: lipase maturation factor family protein, partial [Lacunisphaera sp.]|nr:lipase maturation factor family protein [Lacunisphaera sp.]